MIKRIIEYKNAVLCKLHNRRVAVKATKDNHIIIEFSRLTDNDKPATISEHKRGVLYTGVKMSKEASIALYIALGHYLQSKISDEYIKEKP